MHVDMSLEDMHCDVQVPEQFPSHEVPQLPVQLKLPWFAEHELMQLPSHEP